MDFDPNTDYYAALGVNDQASADEIKKAYRRLAKRYHPDSTGGDKHKEKRFKEVSSAYEVLGDADRRKQYDAFRAGPQVPPGFNFDFGGAGGRAGFGGIDLGDIFSQVFSGAGAGPGGDGGVRWSFSTGDIGPDPEMGGPRTRRRRRQAPRPRPPAETTIKAADGTPLVQRGNHVYTDVRVDIDQAILGSVVHVSTLSGKANVKIPPGTSSGAKLRLKGKGARGPNGTRGDHYVTVQIDVPTALDDEAKKLLVQFMQRTKRSR